MSQASNFTKVKIKGARADSNTVTDVPLQIQAVSGQTGDLAQFLDSSGTVVAKLNASGQLVMTAAASLADPFGLGGQLKMVRAKYDFAVDGGAVSTITVATNGIIPDNAIILGGMLNATTALTSGGSATIAVGTSAGSSASSIKAATAVASYSADALLAVVPLWTAATAVKMTAAGSVTVSIATAALTAGVLEITLFYYVAAA
jgi:hypothetical protein